MAQHGVATVLIYVGVVYPFDQNCYWQASIHLGVYWLSIPTKLTCQRAPSCSHVHYTAASLMAKYYALCTRVKVQLTDEIKGTPFSQ